MREYILRRIDAIFFTNADGVTTPCDLVDSAGISLLTGQTLERPAIIGTILDRVYSVGGAAATVDLTTKFSGATSYAVSPATTGVSISGSTLTINPTAIVAQRTLTVTGSNGAGTSDPLTFALTVNAVSPTSTAALPDRSLTVGDAAVTLALGDYFASAASYSVSPTGLGVSISGSTLTISAAAERNGTYTVTASNSTGQTVSDAFALVVGAAVTAPSPFVAGDWTLATGLAANQLVVSINSLPANGGSPITAIQYSANSGTWTPLGGAGTGSRTLTMPAAGTSYSVRLRAVNAAGNSTPSDTKTATSGAADTSAQRVIVLTDYAGDCDDAAALAVACKAHDDGDIELLGIVATSNVATSAAGVYGQLMAYGQETIPVYAYQGAIGTYNNRISAPVRDAHGVPGQTRTAFQDDVIGLRTMLAAAPDGSVKMIDVGAPISTSRLLDSPADSISPMTGRELVAAKVSGLWMMAGEFTSTRVEYNADRDVASTQNVYQTWPTPVYAHGAEVGGTILTAPGPGTASGVDPVKTAFDAFDVASPTSLEVYLGRRARSSWDPACVHHAIYGNQSFYNYAGANGTITVSATGVTTWSATPAGNRFQVGKAASDAAIAADIQAMIDAFAIVVPAEMQSMTFALNEGTGTSVTSDQGDAGAGVNTTWGAAPTRLNFNGTSSRLSLGRPSASNDLSDFIVAAVVRFGSVSGTPVLFGRNGTDEVGKQFFFRVNNGLLQYVPFQGKSAAVIDGSTVAANEWGLLLAFGRLDAVTIRQNGVTTAADASHPALNRNPEVQAAPYIIGARYSLSGGNYIYRDFFNGSIAASEIVHGATAADIPAVEQRLRDIATTKGITLP